MKDLFILILIASAGTSLGEESRNLTRKRNSSIQIFPESEIIDFEDPYDLEEDELEEDELEFIRFLQQESSFSFSYQYEPSTSPSAVPTTKNPTATPNNDPTSSPTTKAPTTSPTTSSPTASPVTSSPTKTSSPTMAPSTTIKPSSAPSALTQCTDDPTYTYFAAYRTCQYIDSDSPRRDYYCDIQDVIDNCPRTCGQCCYDSPTFTFDVRDKPRTCNWISLQGNRPDKFCPEVVEGGGTIYDYCPKSCEICRYQFPTIAPIGPPTISPTSSPTAEYCSNDDEWNWFASPRVTCKWIRNKEERRQKFCVKNSVKESCPQSCGLCCMNNQDYTFFDNGGARRGCNWIKLQNVAYRQDEYCRTFQNGMMVRDACPYSCDFCFGTVTAAPTPSAPATPHPTPALCLNDDSYVHISYDKATCKWIRNKEERRKKYCVKSGVLESCPQSCGLCCMDDPEFTFNVNGQSVDCVWVGAAKERMDLYCDTWQTTDMVRNSCPFSCHRCLDPIL